MLLKSPWEALKGLPGRAWKAPLGGPKKGVWKGLYVGPERVPKGGPGRAIILNSRGPGWAWNTIILGVSKPTQKCPEGRVWLGAQALKSGPGTLGKPRFLGVPRGAPRVPSPQLYMMKESAISGHPAAFANWLQTLPNIFQGKIKGNFSYL